MTVLTEVFLKLFATPYVLPLFDFSLFFCLSRTGRGGGKSDQKVSELEKERSALDDIDMQIALAEQALNSS
eukprot:m.33419 g.33419  ORF g.33419 m.33419 type:complete len:71 (+) comp9858_c3_seq12:2357-2569(+)